MFVLLERLGRVISSEDINSVSVKMDIQTQHAPIFPTSSTGSLYVRTETIAQARVNITLKDGSVIPYTTIVLNLNKAEDHYTDSKAFRSLKTADQAWIIDRVQRMINYLNKSENHEKISAQLKAQPFEVMATETPTAKYTIPPPHTEDDIKNQSVRIKKITQMLEAKTEINNDLDYDVAIQHVDNGSILAPLLEELMSLTAILNGSQK